MNNKAVNSIINHKSINFFLTAIFLFFLFSVSFSGSVRPVFALQDSIRKEVYKDKKPKPQPAKSPQSSKIPQPKRAKVSNPTPKPASTVPAKKKTAPKRAKKNLINVVLTTEQPDSEVWLNDEFFGMTDKDSTLSTKVAPNEYRVSVKKNEQVLFSGKTISVSAEKTDFNLFDETPVKVPQPEIKTEVKAEDKKSDEEQAEETSRQVREILNNYADPLTTDSVTAEDWKLVYQSAQLGTLQGFTAVQIEAQRWFASGQIELAEKNYANAFTAFNKAIEFMPNSPLPFYGLGVTYLADKQPEEAIKAFQRALQLDPKMAMAYRGLGDAQRLFGKRKEAVSAYKNAIQLGYPTAETRLRLAVALSETDHADESFKLLEELAENAPNAEVYVALGDVYRQRKRDISALEVYRKAIEEQPDLAVAYFKLANILLDQREYTKARDAFEKAVELDPKGKTFNLVEAKKGKREAASKIK